MVKSSNFINFHLLSMRYISVKKGRGNYMLGCKFNSEVNSVQGSLGVQCLCYFLFQIIDAVAWSFLSCLKLRRLVYSGASSPPRQARHLPWLIFETTINYKKWPKQLGRFEEKNYLYFSTKQKTP